MAIETDIQDAIAKNLPSAVGDALRERLNAIPLLEAKIAKLEKAAVESFEHRRRLEQENISLRAQVEDAKNILKREADLVRAARHNEVQSAVLAAESRLVSSFLDRQEKIVLAVFANNRFKYNESRQDGHAFMPMPSPNNQYPCPVTATVPTTRTVDGEGDVPAIPK